MRSSGASSGFKSGTETPAFRTEVTPPRFASACPPDRVFKIDDLMAFRRGRGDLIFSCVMLGVALFFLASFWTQTGWESRKLPDEMGSYLMRQLGIIEGEGRLERLGRILRQSWVAPGICLVILLPSALWNLRKSWAVHQWRKRFLLPTGAREEVTRWLKALEFAGWFVAYTMLVPVLGYLLATLLMGTALPYRMGYRSARWMRICLAASFAIVLVFRSGLQIKTPVNIWLYNQLPAELGSFMKIWF